MLEMTPAASRAFVTLFQAFTSTITSKVFLLAARG